MTRTLEQNTAKNIFLAFLSWIFNPKMWYANLFAVILGVFIFIDFYIAWKIFIHTLPILQLTPETFQEVRIMAITAFGIMALFLLAYPSLFMLGNTFDGLIHVRDYQRGYVDNDIDEMKEYCFDACPITVYAIAPFKVLRYSLKSLIQTIKKI